MKTNTFKYILFGGFFVFLIACSTKRNTFLSRNSHALSTEYNILYNGGIALEKGINDLKSQYKDNFWEILPIERMQVTEENLMPTESKNTDFERAETKAIKAIQKHSMNIQGQEKNPQMDEAYLMLGKARYYDQRFVPALEAFNYVLYKYPSSDKIYEVKIWREKTNMRLENDALAVNNLRRLLKEKRLDDQIFADANATLSQAFLNLEEKDSAIAKLENAIQYTKSNEEKARYRFILGQIYEELGKKDTAYKSYQSVINMNRKAARQYVIHAHAKQAQYFDFKKGDTAAFVKKYKDLIEDRENRPFLDVLNYQLGLFYDKQKKYNQATKYYNASLKKKSQDSYLVASNYRNLADIYFNTAKYITSGKYYDSTLVHLKPRTREFNLIKKKRENLDDVIKYEGIAQRNDSIINLFNMKDSERIQFFETYIERLKKETAKKELAEKTALAKQSQESKEGKSDVKLKDGPVLDLNAGKKASTLPPALSSPGTGNKESDFYFYNPTTVAYGKTEFKKTWGNRTLKDNWRLSSSSSKNESKEDVKDNGNENEKSKEDKAVEEQYSTEFYIKQIPTSQTVIDSLSKERNFAYYQLGVIYKEKFKEYQLAANKLEQLLKNKPEERLILPTMYNLYKLYELLDKTKAEAMKAKIIALYPQSRYAQILSNTEDSAGALTDSPVVVYEKLFQEYQNGEYRTALLSTEKAIDQFVGDEMIPKFELLRANLIGKLKGLEEYRKALNFVSLNYPNSDEGKQAEKLLGTDIQKLEALSFSQNPSSSWRILYRADHPEDKKTKALLEKLTKFAKERTVEKLSISKDVYTIDKNFIVIYGINTEEKAKGIAQVLKDFKEYKIEEPAIVISTDNYSVVQIKKNLEDFLSGKITEPPLKENKTGDIPKNADNKIPGDLKKSVENKTSPEELKMQENKKMLEEKDEINIGLPPSPQMQSTPKKQ